MPIRRDQTSIWTRFPSHNEQITENLKGKEMLGWLNKPGGLICEMIISESKIVLSSFTVGMGMCCEYGKSGDKH